MLNLRPFQVVLLTGSLLLFLGSIAFVALYRPPACEETGDCPVRITDDINIWGTLESRVFDTELRNLTSGSDRFSNIQYSEFTESEFVPAFVDALAEGAGPDLVVISQDQLVELRSKLYALSYDFYTERTFKDTFVEGTEIFARNDGIYALPFAADPLVMYWNRDIFSSNNIAVPPRTWETLRNDTVPRLTRAGGAFDIVQSAVALGEYRNIRNANAVISMLMLQSGSDIVAETADSYEIVFQQNAINGQSGMNPTTAALAFYTEFANPASSLYSWNRSMPEDRQRFLSGDLAIYFGLGSELPDIQAANPNLNFDMAPVPQGEGANTLRNFADFYALAIPKQAKNVSASYEVASVLVAPETATMIAESLDMAVVHREVQALGTTNAFQQIRNQGALIARGWLEPSRSDTDRIFLAMVEDVTSGRLQVASAINDAIERFRLAFN